METLANGYQLEIPAGAFPLSTDSVLLADFVRLPKNARVLDLGSGCGTLGVFLCAADPGCHVTGIELSAGAHAAALNNICANGLSDRLESICADLRQIPEFLSPGSFHVCVSNPPYFSGGPAGKNDPRARRDDTCTLEQLLRSAAWALRYGGELYLVHKPEKLAQLCACAAGASLEPKRLCLVRHRPGSEVSLILLQCRKGGKPGLSWQELYLYNADGSPSEDHRRIYRI